MHNGRARIFDHHRFTTLTDVNRRSKRVSPLRSQVVHGLLTFNTVGIRSVVAPHSIVLTFRRGGAITRLLISHPGLAFSQLPVCSNSLSGVANFILGASVLLTGIGRTVRGPLARFGHSVAFMFSGVGLFSLLRLVLGGHVRVTVAINRCNRMGKLIALRSIFRALLNLRVISRVSHIRSVRTLTQRVVSEHMRHLNVGLDSSRRCRSDGARDGL